MENVWLIEDSDSILKLDGGFPDGAGLKFGDLDPVIFVIVVRFLVLFMVFGLLLGHVNAVFLLHWLKVLLFKRYGQMRQVDEFPPFLSVY